MLWISNQFVEIMKEDPNVIKIKNILLTKPSKENFNNLPMISIYDSEFGIESRGLSSKLGESTREISEMFNSDGICKIFKLKHRPIKPISIEIKNEGLKRETNDYKCDYSKGNIIFYNPPIKGENNIIVKYLIKTDEIIGLKLKIKYFMDIFSTDYVQCDTMTIDVMKNMLLNDEKYNNIGLTVIPIRGIRISEEDYPDIDNKSIFGRRLEYILEKDLKVERKITTIDEIKISNIDSIIGSVNLTRDP